MATNAGHLLGIRAHCHRASTANTTRCCLHNNRQTRLVRGVGLLRRYSTQTHERETSLTRARSHTARAVTHRTRTHIHHIVYNFSDLPFDYHHMEHGKFFSHFLSLNVYRSKDNRTGAVRAVRAVCLSVCPSVRLPVRVCVLARVHLHTCLLIITLLSEMF